MTMISHRDMVVWQRSIELTQAIYALASLLPPSENYALAAQMRRAVVSISSNIAEGKARRSLKDYIHFLSIAKGSAAELDSQLETVSRQYPGISVEGTTSILFEVEKMLSSLISKLQLKT